MLKKIFPIILIFFTTLFIFTFLSIGYLFKQLSLGNFNQVSKISKAIHYLVTPLSALSFHQLKDIEIAKEVLEIIEIAPKLLSKLTTTSQEDILDINNIKEVNQVVLTALNKVDSQLPRSLVIKNILTNQQTTKLQQLLTASQDLEVILTNLVDKDQKILIVFQNSDEIRATGGFMGSYAILDIKEGKVIEIVVEDIYDASGQFTGYFSAPNGVKKYLSGDQGLKLQDANWHPDFPTSAKTILDFFALGKRKNINTLIAVNLDYAKLLLNFTKEIKLLDYDTKINSSNINTVLRTDRAEFFPGSQQKKHILSQLLTQVKLKIASLDNQDKLALVKQTLNQLEIHNIQLYSNYQKINSIYSKRNFREEIYRDEYTDNLMLVESNVGINKANRSITRKVEMASTNFQSTVSLTLTNNGKKNNSLTKLTPSEFIKNLDDEEQGYINYQRVITPPTWKVESIYINDQLLTTWHTQVITNSKNQQFQEVGFLTTTPVATTTTVIINYSHLVGIKDKLLIQKQPGIPATVYELEINDNQHSILLEKDEEIKTH